MSLQRRASDIMLHLRDVRRMLEGVIPPAMCTVSADGVPHVTYLSQAEFIDDEHIALSYQFFNRSRQNVLATRRAALSVEDPYTGGGVELQVEYVRTDTDGPVFARLSAKLAGIASHTGMEKVFALRGADVYRVLGVRRVGGRQELPAAAPRCDLAAGTRRLSERLGACAALGELLDAFIDGLQADLCIQHGMLVIADPSRDVFYSVASFGYAASGVGAELPFGEGLIGIAAREGTPLRIGHMSRMHLYGRAARERMQALGLEGVLEDEIPLPGLSDPRSQLAVPLRAAGRTIGVLLVESDEDQFFGYDDEDALMLLGAQFASAMRLLDSGDAPATTTASVPDTAPPPAPAHAAPDPTPLRVRRFRRDDSVFFDDAYVIKGVAGAILWKLLRRWHDEGRDDISNRELRHAHDLRLPEVQDNLEVRLLLLQRRLDDRAAPVRLRKTGRGLWRLDVAGPVQLIGDDSGD